MEKKTKTVRVKRKPVKNILAEQKTNSDYQIEQEEKDKIEKAKKFLTYSGVTFFTVFIFFIWFVNFQINFKEKNNDPDVKSLGTQLFGAVDELKDETKEGWDQIKKAAEVQEKLLSQQSSSTEVLIATSSASTTENTLPIDMTTEEFKLKLKELEKKLNEGVE